MDDAPSLPPREGLIHVVGAAILDGRGRCLVARRAAHVANAGFWEFPGGKVEAGEDPRLALEREIAEELGLIVQVGAFLGRGEASPTTDRTIVLDVYLAGLRDLGEGPAAEPPWLTDHDEVRWITATDIDALVWAAADVPILPALRSRLGGLSGSAPRS